MIKPYKCRECDENKPVKFRGDRKNQCAKCEYVNNKEKIAATQKKYRAKNKAKLAAKSREYYTNNKEKVAGYYRKYRANNKEKIAATQKKYHQKYRAKNKAKLAAKSREYYTNNKEKVAGYYRKYRANNKEKIAATQKKYHQVSKIYITDTYVRVIIRKKYNISQEMITEQMIKAEREIITINRLFRRLKNGKTTYRKGIKRADAKTN